ncbi:MAG TPA: polymer-forming cytoskeletal protein [Steroidobacteraceae bacterium]|nr:polymer-forming cytoskeletal protein [Steroidobacteraceae bacterium]
MWGSKRNERAPFDDLLDERPNAEPKVEAPAAPPAPTAPEPRAERFQPTPAREEPVVETGSVLGRTLTFHGDLSADEDLVLQGRVEGSITHTGCLTIGESGTTIGDVAARQIIVEGSVEGDLSATGSVSVRSGGAVHGSIVAPRVALADGARFNGSIDMDGAQAAQRTTPAASGRHSDQDDASATAPRASGAAG